MRKLISIITILLLLTAPTWAGPRIIQGGNAPPPASETVSGIIELATDAETVTGSATGVVTTPANITARLAAPGSIGLTTAVPEISVAVANNGRAIVDTHYETSWIPAASTTPTATNGAVMGTKEFATNDINADYLAFDTTTEQYAEFQFPMPEGWDRSTFKAKFFWSPTDDTGSTQNTVEWEIACGAISNDDAFDAALGTSQVISDTILAGESGDNHITAATPAITCAGTPALGDLIHFKISRNVGGTDDYGANALLWGVWIQIKITNSVAAW